MKLRKENEMDTSKLRFNIEVTYDCDEGEGCYESVDDGTFDEAMKLFSELDSRTWISGYYHYFSINQFDIEDENGEFIDISKILDGEFEWLSDCYNTSDKNEASEIPVGVLEFLEALKNGDAWFKQKQTKELKKRIAKLEKELKSAKKELETLEREQA